VGVRCIGLASVSVIFFRLDFRNCSVATVWLLLFCIILHLLTIIHEETSIVLNSGFVILLVNCSPPVEICYIYCMSKHFFLFNKDRQRRSGR
jgi:membrane-bound ClpP family serine protease